MENQNNQLLLLYIYCRLFVVTVFYNYISWSRYNHIEQQFNDVFVHETVAKNFTCQRLEEYM
jgi:hypothetical protein